MRIIMIDNYDSFTYNLVHLLQFQIGEENVKVVRNDEIQMDEVAHFDKIILSPGPGIPSESGQLMDLIMTFKSSKPILGVCLGHQALGEAFGAKLYNLDEVYHGISTEIKILVEDKIFEGIKSPMSVGRYHSWAIKDIPDELEVTSVDEKGIVMSFRHRNLPIGGVQFHPESVLTPLGPKIIQNWINA